MALSAAVDLNWSYSHSFGCFCFAGRYEEYTLW